MRKPHVLLKSKQEGRLGRARQTEHQAQETVKMPPMSTSAATPCFLSEAKDIIAKQQHLSTRSLDEAERLSP